MMRNVWLAVAAAQVFSLPLIRVASALDLRTAVIQRGDFALTGNTLTHDCRPGVPLPTIGVVGACGSNTVDVGADVYWRSDSPLAGSAEANTSITATQARSSALLMLPVGASVTHAWLFWAGVQPTADTSVVFDRPGTFSQTAVADDSVNSAAPPGYQSVADVTLAVQTHGGGLYRVSGVESAVLANQLTSLAYSGWWLVVFYELDGAPPRHLTLSDGFNRVDSEASNSTFVFGFTAPPLGIGAKLGVVGYGGRVGSLDSIRWNGALVGDVSNPTNDLFNGTRTDLGLAVSVLGDLPRLSGAPDSLGFDMDIIDATALVTPTSQTAILTVESTNDEVYLGALITSVVSVVPDLQTSTKTASDLDGAPLEPGDTVEYTITVVNTGDPGTGLTLIDDLPPEVTYVTGSMVITTGANAGPKTDAGDTDQADFDPLARRVTARLGEDAGGTFGGSLSTGGSTSLRFRVTVNADADGRIVNQAVVSASPGGESPPVLFLTDGNGDGPGAPATLLLVDADLDGLSDGDENEAGTDPDDADSDDDGVRDGDEPLWDVDSDGADRLINALDPDSDDDGLPDGLELGLGCSDEDTDVSRHACLPDGDAGATVTNPLDLDSDNGGVRDGSEDGNRNGVLDAGETDPTPDHGGDDNAVADNDSDGVGDELEEALFTDPDDADSDDDGLMDGEEMNPAIDTDGDGLPNILDPDSDDDGLPDGTEQSRLCTSPATDLSFGWCFPDIRPDNSTGVLLADTDFGGVEDGSEDGDLNGAVGLLETSPNNPDNDFIVLDSDGDGLSDPLETFLGGNLLDVDTDDDGVLDGDEPNPSLDMDGDDLIDLLDHDSDGDGLFDGTEMGRDCSKDATNTVIGHCIADADPLTTTSAVIADSDHGGVPDGVEDTDHDGEIDEGEFNPNDPSDDPCVIPPAEVCNFVDDNCDGVTDETFDVGLPCVLGLGICQVVGEWTCDLDGDRECVGEPGPAGTEICDSIDNDCDGLTDDGFGLDGPCTSGDGICEVAGGLICDGPGGTKCDAVPGPASIEICDGEDDDCDTVVDDGFNVGTECLFSTGICAVTGTIECDALGGAGCIGEALPASAEICNTLDDDCDGGTDEGLGLGDVCSVGTGACVVISNQVCALDGGTECPAVALPGTAETCNDIDDDCNNTTDDNFGVGNVCVAGNGACEVSGEFECDGNGGVLCNAAPDVPGTESCNGIDDDCNLSTDDVVGAGDDCEVGLGVCAAPGTLGCGLLGALICNGAPLAAGVEACNALDDDCDGDTDEGFGLGTACTAGQGECAATGVTACDDGGEAACSAVAGTPGTETCDATDDDCDGDTDEDFGLGAACTVGVGVCAATGVTVCGSAAAAVCSVTEGAAGVEVCNSLDDDCDGTTDEELGLGDACSVGAGACARSGVTECGVDGTTVCGVAAGPPGDEVCNAIDDDCDGATDEAGTDGIGPCDLDGDGVANDADNCPEKANADQADADNDEIGDACETAVPDSDSGLHVRGTTFCDMGSGTPTGVTGMAMFGALGLLLLVFRARRSANGLALFLLGGVVLASGGANAQAIRLHQPLASDHNFVSTDSAWTLPSWYPSAGFYIDYANRPLVLVDDSDGSEESFIEHQIQADFVAAIGFPGGLELGIGFPVALFQEPEGDRTPTGASLPTTAAGDLRIIPKWAMYKNPHGFGIALAVPVTVPTGDRAAFTGHDAVTVEPRLILDGDMGQWFRMALSVGYLLRSEATQNVTLRTGHELRVGLGFEAQIIPGTLSFIGEGIAKIAADPDTELSIDTAPAELGGALRIKPGKEHAITIGAGFALTDGYGAPRVHTYLGYMYTKQAPIDSDKDGLYDPDDQCPFEPEDFDGFEDKDGCPDLDNDKDGIPDTRDKCPDIAEDKDGFEDEDGCPDPDNDGDGILDINDKCPNEPEDKDGFQDEDGCPDPDNDGDGILDINDKCPNDPETFNGVDDEDGCPDIRAVITKTEIKVGVIYFDTNKAIIKPESYPVVDDVVEAMKTHPEILFIEVEGHTDERASDKYNLRLSDKRSKAVVEYLVAHGVEKGRLSSKGYGERKPVAEGHNEEAWSQNRRSVFRIHKRKEE